MADSIRLREDYRSGTITDNPLAFDDTTAHSVEFVELPEITAGHHMVCTLDPLGATNGPETAWITAHTAGADVVTFLRGREGPGGSTAVEHPAGTPWCIGLGYSDVIHHCTEATAPLGNGLPFPGQMADFHDKSRIARASDTGQWVRIANYAPAGRTGATLKRNAAQAVPHLTATKLQWDTVTFDSDSFQSAADTLTVPAGLGGLYVCTVSCRYAANGDNQFYLSVQVNNAALPDDAWMSLQIGNTIYAERQTAGFNGIPLAAADTVTATVVQTTGSPTDYRSRVDLYRIGG
jgi:hypothetical protein